MTSWSLSGTPLILASASPTRASLLQAAKVSFETEPAHLDEEAIKQSALQDDFCHDELVILLAEMKAESVSRRRPGYVLGCDQILVCENRLFSKPRSYDEAKSHLTDLQGRPHQLKTACVLFHDQKRIWHHISTSSLVMRSLSDKDIDNYIASFPEACLSTPGAYQIENGGAHLFSEINGVSYDILGLPLLALLSFLREHGLTTTKEALTGC